MCLSAPVRKGSAAGGWGERTSCTCFPVSFAVTPLPSTASLSCAMEKQGISPPDRFPAPNVPSTWTSTDHAYLPGGIHDALLGLRLEVPAREVSHGRAYVCCINVRGMPLSLRRLGHLGGKRLPVPCPSSPPDRAVLIERQASRDQRLELLATGRGRGQATLIVQHSSMKKSAARGH